MQPEKPSHVPRTSIVTEPCYGRQRQYRDRQIIGYVSVDSGTLQIKDPCYENSSVGLHDYDQIVNITLQH